MTRTMFCAILLLFGGFMEEKDVSYVEKIIGYTFRNKALLVQAFTRSSFNPEAQRDSELLEFFGDRVIEHIVAQLLNIYLVSEDNYGINSKYTEGDLTELKSFLVDNDHLGSRCEDFGFDKLLRLGKNEKTKNSYKSDLIESIVGAVAIDSYYDERELYYIVALLVDPTPYIISPSVRDLLELKKWCKLKGLGTLLIETTKLEEDGFTTYKVVMIAGNYKTVKRDNAKVSAILAAATLINQEIYKNKENITVKDFLKNMNENNGKGYLVKLKKSGFYNHLTIEEKQNDNGEWTVSYYLDGLTVCFSDKDKTNANKICSLLCINSLIHRGSRIDATISPLLIKLGYIA